MDRPSCYDKAAELLSRRSHFRRQLEEKLLARSYEPAEVEECLGRLLELGLLDDRRTAEEFIAARLRRGPLGRRRMYLELVKRGLDEDLAEEALAVSFPEDDLGAARAAAAIWLRRGRDDPAALARHLDRKGFRIGSILRIVEELRSEREGG